MNGHIKQKQSLRHSKQTWLPEGEREWGREKIRGMELTDPNYCNKIDRQQ